jgi:hypothetical protein
MLANLLLGAATMGLCLALQIALLTRALIYYARHQSDRDQATFLRTLSRLNGVMVLLVLGNIAQIAVWALLYQVLGEFDQYPTAFYHSAVNFATLGYGDIVMSEQRRLLGPLQSMNGVLMVGVSTAAFMTTLRDALKQYGRHAAPADARHHLKRLVDSGGE